MGNAEAQIRDLFSEAEKCTSRAKRYVELALQIATRNRIRLSSELRRRYCRRCHAFLRPGKNLSVRTREGKLIYLCRECGERWRRPL